MQVNFCGRPASVLLHPEYIERARKLGRNVAAAMMMPIEEVRYMGEDSAVSCPVCHCNVLKVPGRLPEVFCPVCWVRGKVHMEGTEMKVTWDEESKRIPRFSERGVFSHLDLIKNLQKTFYENEDKVKEMKKKYLGIDETTDVLSFPLQENLIKSKISKNIDFRYRVAKMAELGSRMTQKEVVKKNS